MRQVLNKSMIVMAAASGILSAAGGYAHADSSAGAVAANSPGVASGNAVQVPVHVPVNLCGNTVNVIALLNPAFGNSCANVSSHDDHAGGHANGGHANGGHSNGGHGNGGHDEGSYGDDAYGGGHGSSGADAEGAAVGSPGVGSGNAVQAPVDIPVNACGNTVDVVGLLNPAGGNTCVNDSGDDHEVPPVEPPVEEPPTVEPPTSKPPVEPPTSKPPVDEPPATTPGPNAPGPQLAQTGAGDIGLAGGASAALLLGGAVLMRRTRESRN